MSSFTPAPATADLGVFGLGVMGANLARNLARHGHAVAVFNRTLARTERLIERHGSEGDFVPAADLKDFVASLRTPRVAIIMVQAGAATEEVIEELAALMEPGDIIVDAGNTLYTDTRRREVSLRERGLHFVGMGVSGGEEGALNGPSIMPGGTAESYKRLGPMLESISAHVDGVPCCTHVGPDGAGHFVKMVHNGIEYADMQLIAEAYDLLRHGSKIAAYAQGFDEIATASAQLDWNIDLGAMARIWRGGCIIRARFLDDITRAYDENPGLASLLTAPVFASSLATVLPAWRQVVATSATAGVPAPAFASSLAYVDQLRSPRLPAALIQGQRDFFGSHTYHRTDDVEGVYHTLWATSERTEEKWS